MEADSERLARLGFRVAFAGWLLLATALVVPEWRPSGLSPSLVQLLLTPLPTSSPTCVDCGGSGVAGLEVVACACVAFLLLLAGSWAFRRGREIPDAAWGISVVVLLLGLFLLAVVAWDLASSIFGPSLDDAGRAVPGPNWSVLADSLHWLELVGLLFVVVGNLLGAIGLARRPRSVMVDWDAMR